MRIPLSDWSNIQFWVVPNHFHDRVQLGQVDRPVHGSLTHGAWSSPLRHINLLEMDASWSVLLNFASQLKDKHVMVQTDNTTVAVYLDRQGGKQVFSPPQPGIGFSGSDSLGGCSFGLFEGMRFLSITCLLIATY